MELDLLASQVCVCVCVRTCVRERGEYLAVQWLIGLLTHLVSQQILWYTAHTMDSCTPPYQLREINNYNQCTF